MFLTIEILLHVIIYPHARELFAFEKTSLQRSLHRESKRQEKWTMRNRKRGCKNFSDLYNATPSLKGINWQK